MNYPKTTVIVYTGGIERVHGWLLHIRRAKSPDDDKFLQVVIEDRDEAIKIVESLQRAIEGTKS